MMFVWFLSLDWARSELISVEPSNVPISDNCCTVVIGIVLRHLVYHSLL